MIYMMKFLNGSRHNTVIRGMKRRSNLLITPPQQVISITDYRILITVFFFTFSFSLFTFHSLAQDVSIKIHISGVAESKITLLPLTGTNALKPIVEKSGIKNGKTQSISVSKDILPAEFVLRFDYKEKETSAPYPCEKHIIVNEQNLELWVNPMYCNNNDSTYFQENEKENTVFARFNTENSKQKEKLGLLQNFLLNYDDIQSVFYQQGIEEYEKRRNNYNQWLTEQTTQHKDMFVSHTFKFQYVPQIDFKGDESARMQNVLTHYFDGIDFQDTMLLNTQELNNFITTYVNMYASIAKTQSDLDSLYPLIGKTAIEKARFGNPKVYGWMVDYFYRGYEAYGINKGMAMLENHINNPNCLTSKKQQIIKRLDGMTKLVPEAKAPNFILRDNEHNDFDFHSYKGTAKYKLLLFWSTDCDYCQHLVNDLAQWYNTEGNKEMLDIIAVSLDETETEVQQWEKVIISLPGWKHLHAKKGVNSVVANNYAILSTPVLFLIESESNIIKGIPNNLEQLIKILGK